MPDLAGLRVCFVAGTLGQGGAERQLFYALRELVAHGARPRVLCLTQGEFWEARIRALGVAVTWVGQSGSRVRRLARIMRELRRDRPDVLQSQHFYTNLYVVAAARMLGIPEIGALRSDAISEVAGTGSLFGPLSLRLPRVVAANSRTAMTNAVVLGADVAGLVFLPNVVDTDGFIVRARPDRAVVRLLAVGSLVPAKRFDRFLRVVARVRQRATSDVRGTIVGDGPLCDDLQALASQLGLADDCLTFAGRAPEMAGYYDAADLLVLTSDWEGTPNVVIEAMASGLPVVATRVGGVADVTPPADAAWLCDPDDEDGLVDAVVALCDDGDERRARGQRGHAFVAQRHAASRLDGALQHLYAVASAARPSSKAAR